MTTRAEVSRHTDAAFGHMPIASIETSAIAAVITFRRRPNPMRGPDDTCFTRFELKGSRQELIGARYGENIHGLDACAFRPPADRIEVLQAGAERLVLELSYNAGEFLSRYTLRDDEPVVQIDYLRYGSYKVFNIVDLAAPGGQHERMKGTTRVLGEAGWKRPIVYHEQPYWNVHLEPGKVFFESSDEADAGSLNYRGHMVMVAGDPRRGVGLGRVMPIYREGQAGGIRCIKLLWDKGFENFPSYSEVQERRPFRGFLFGFDRGFDAALALGRALVDRTCDELPHR